MRAGVSLCFALVAAGLSAGCTGQPRTYVANPAPRPTHAVAARHAPAPTTKPAVLSAAEKERLFRSFEDEQRGKATQASTGPR